tara:strand:+ start:134 stop:718 length:585 start_codon:yes stop_codon:yes gene_type:complete
MALRKSQKSLRTWTEQKWTTPSGKKSSETGEVYAPKKTIEKLKSTAKGRRKLAAANRKKRKATREGKQHANHGLHSRKKLNQGTRTTDDLYMDYFQPKFNMAYNENTQLKNATDKGLWRMIRNRITEVGEYNDKYYIMPTISFTTAEPIQGKQVLQQALPLIEEGTIGGYGSKKEAQAALNKMMKNLVKEAKIG